MDALSPPRIEGRGHPESAWRCSPWLTALPVHPFDTLLGDVRRIVVVSPHPDDEVLGCGGLIHYARRSGLAVRLLSVTQGEACYPDHPRWSPDYLRQLRARELLCAAAALGVPPEAIRSLGFPDGEVGARESLLGDSLQDHLAPGDHVFCTAAWDGHPDHEASGRAARTAADRKGVRLSEFPVWAWHWSDPGLATPPAPGARRYALDAASWEAKRRALRHFTSQCQGPGDRPAILPPHAVERFARREETFFHVIA